MKKSKNVFAIILLLAIALLGLATCGAKGAEPPCAECEALKAQAVAKTAPPVRKAAPAVVGQPTLASAVIKTTARVRVFSSIRAGDGPVRRLARAFRAGCH